MNIKNMNWAVLVLLIVTAAACSEGTPKPVVDDRTDDPAGDPAPNRYELILKNWRIDTATHKGTPDISSRGKSIEFFQDFTYNFNGSLQGSWFFTADTATVVIDEGKSYQQDWTVVELTEERFEVDFKSPFTGGASTWIMHPKP